MHVLLITAGSHGDVNPFIGVARALQLRGHRATILANPYYQPQVAEAGVGFEPFGEHFDLRDLKTRFPDIMHPSRGAQVVLREMILPHAAETFALLPSLLKSLGVDAVVHHHICVGVPSVCERAGVAYASATLAPMLWLSKGDVYSPLWWSPLHPSPPARWLLRKLGPLAVRLQFDGPINRVRREAGFPAMKDCFRAAIRGGPLPLGLWSPTLRGPLEGDPEHGIICGFPWHDRHGDHEHPSHEIEDFLADCERRNEPPILFALGTAAVHVAGRFYHDAADACRLLGRRGLLLMGPAAAPPENLPAGSIAVSYAPFSAVMPRCAVNVHHGGVGSTGQGMRAGRPTVIVAHAHDQFDNAARVKRMGISETIPRHRLTARRFAGAIAEMLGSPAAAARAREVGAKVERERGAETAAAAIERLVRG